VGAVELQRGRDSGGSGSINVDCADAIAASLKLDSSHRGTYFAFSPLYSGNYGLCKSVQADTL
jgi:hypothetical protein